ncbi:hypothetical protein [Pseudonocardia sp. HH130630-07]|uniref:hypothetical protein n=1 Tax=Pseudonocardia sp. HH130630-07 TaxID=1690815 RepID=UPI0008153324|nr:hypothetical protein [Pseudonocardia sp. HH130630-07]ANY05537.1 hypothetical protein AFB00_03590 [Pseudonocardia sp. HH130630-07]
MKYLFVNGRLAIQIRYWEEPGFGDGGARVELRRVTQVEGTAHRAGAAGCTVSPVRPDGLWRADLFLNLDRPGEGCFHHHPTFSATDVGGREFERAITDDPRRWIEDRLRDLPALLALCGGEDVLSSVDLDEHRRALPLMLTAVEQCLARLPAELVRRHASAGS